MSDNRLQGLFGGSPLATLVKLALLSLLVGVILAAFDLTPWSLFHYIRHSFHEIFGFGMEAVHRIIGYLAAGAVIVVPIWLLMRLLSRRK